MKEIVFLCWDEDVKNNLNAVSGYICIEPVCFSENQKFFNFIEGKKDVLAFIDTLLPKENGYLVCKKTKEKNPQTKTVLLIAKGLHKEEIAKRWNADYILEKSVDWKELGEILKSEGINFPPPFEEGEGEPQEFLQVILDALLTNRKMLMMVEGERATTTIKIADGWAELEGIRTLMDIFEDDKIFFRTEPLKDMMPSEGLVHLSQVIRGLIKIGVKSENLVKEKFSVVEGAEIPWFLTPVEREFLKSLQKRSLRTLNIEEKEMNEMIYFLSIMNLIKMEYTPEKSSE